MRIVALSLLSACLLAAADPMPLFNGKDLTGWRMLGPGRFTVEDGMLKTEGGMGLLYYTGQKVGNQTLRVVFKTTGDHDNSGVFIRLPEPPIDQWWAVNNGYEVQIDAGGDDWHCTGAIYSISKVTKRTQKPKGEWNTLEIQFDGPVTRITLNGELVNEYTEGQPVPERKQWFEPARGRRPDSGYIGLQNHDGRTTVFFKEVSLIGGTATPISDYKTISQFDRDKLMAAYAGSGKMVLDAVTGLTQEQWNYKAGPDRWSIAEILEHIVLAEQTLFNWGLGGLTSTLAAPETPMKDDELIAGTKDRSHKATAPEILKPTGKWKGGPDLVNEFKLRRTYNEIWLRDTAQDLRGHYLKTPTGTVLSVYQVLEIVPAHSERHLQQILEVKDSPGYPKK
jgi:hypothetical protein